MFVCICQPVFVSVLFLKSEYTYIHTRQTNYPTPPTPPHPTPPTPPPHHRGGGVEGGAGYRGGGGGRGGGGEGWALGGEGGGLLHGISILDLCGRGIGSMTDPGPALFSPIPPYSPHEIQMMRIYEDPTNQIQTSQSQVLGVVSQDSCIPYQQASALHRGVG